MSKEELDAHRTRYETDQRYREQWDADHAPIDLGTGIFRPEDVLLLEELHDCCNLKLPLHPGLLLDVEKRLRQLKGLEETLALHTRDLEAYQAEHGSPDYRYLEDEA